MFVRAGISGRILRNGGRRDTQNSVLYTHPKPKKPKKKFRCYVPFMWPTCIAVFVGLFILMGGTAMCAVGYYADFFSSEENNNGTHSWRDQSDPVVHKHLRTLAYSGPVLMGLGCFIIVVACVVICETRDKMIKIMEEQEKLKRAKEAKTVKPNFYDLIIGQVRKEKTSPVPVEEKAGREKLKDILMRPGSAKSVKSEFGHIRSALKEIPAQIFSIDIEGKEPTSLAPVHSAKPHILPAGENQVTTKYPSASCLHDLLVMTDDELSEIFPGSNSWVSAKTQDPELPERETSKSRASDVRPILYDRDTDTVYSVTVDEQARELESRIAMDAGEDANRPKSSLSRPRTASVSRTGHSASRRASRDSFDTDSADEFTTSNVIWSKNDEESDDASCDTNEVSSQKETQEGTTDSPTRHARTDTLGAICDSSDKYQLLGKNGLHGVRSEEGVSRATTPDVAENHSQISNIVVHAAIHQRPTATDEGRESDSTSSVDEQSSQGEMRRLDSKASISQITAVLPESDDGQTLDSSSLNDDPMNKSDFSSLMDTKVFRPTAYAKRRKSVDSDSVSVPRPKTSLPGNNRGVKVPIVSREPIPRPRTSFMKPTPANPMLTSGSKPVAGITFSRNMPRIKSASLGSVGLRPIRTNVKSVLSRNLKLRQKAGHANSNKNHASKLKTGNQRHRKEDIVDLV